MGAVMVPVALIESRQLLKELTSLSACCAIVSF